MTTVTRRSKPRQKFDVKDVVARFAEHRAAKNLAAEKTAEANRLRDELMPLIVKHGRPEGDKNQHLAIDLPEPIDGCTKLVRRTNQSRYISVDAAEELAQKEGFLDDIQVGTISLNFAGTPAEVKKIKAALRKLGVFELEGLELHEQQVFSQERLMAFHQKNRDVLTEEMLDELFETDETYSFNPA